ncbi:MULTISPECIES: group III truncated hemoglobin [Tenacibaculum]|uniref:group III truncated hemoglobin n=1 Tax=Tenacibaculum TaxID=104267 RepID=UPI0008999837|nr:MULTISPECIES: group III truncated hemoglobin [unclassified Tenacibaculum]RBW56344.1 group III truncated hemoglobin [Tenacibaculum sp. E3R01]SEE46337.1 hemoglobin [Tenacibaculum sp. MAR_2010_89]
MSKREITTRDDVFLLVSTFYDKIKKDDFIGPIFLKVIPEKMWDSHLEKLTDFWETNLFFVRKFKGNPMKVHKDVDKEFSYGISQEHFGRWLQLWFSTIDDLFIGTKANEAKERARNIASMLFFKMFEVKPKPSIQ